MCSVAWSSHTGPIRSRVTKLCGVACGTARVAPVCEAFNTFDVSNEMSGGSVCRIAAATTANTSDVSDNTSVGSGCHHAAAVTVADTGKLSTDALLLGHLCLPAVRCWCPRTGGSQAYSSDRNTNLTSGAGILCVTGNQYRII